MWAGNSGTQPAAGNGTCGTATLSNTLSGASYNSSYVSTHLGQLWQGPLAGGSTQYQYLYCGSNSHLLTGLYPLGTTCTNLTGAVYTSSYDAWGNVTSRFSNGGTTATLSYDGLDRLRRWNDTVTTTNEEWYMYDASGQRVLRRSQTGTGTSNTKFTLYAFGLEEHVYNGAGTLQSSKYYDSLAGYLLGKSDGSATSFFLTDALGSVLATFSATVGSAALLGNQTYGPYGNQQYQKGTMGTAKGFTGQYNDSLTGLDYYNARYYDPVVGVFLSADSVQGNLQGVNPYAYVNGNPETLDDPTGHCAWYDLGCWGQQVVQGVQNFGNTLNNWGQQIGQAAQNFVETVNYYGNLVSSYITHFANSVVQGVVRTFHPLQGPRYALNTDEEFGGPGVGVHLTPPRRGHTIARHVGISLQDLADRAERDALRFRRTFTSTSFTDYDTASWAVDYVITNMTPAQRAAFQRGQAVTMDVHEFVGYGFRFNDRTHSLTYLGDWLHFVRVVPSRDPNNPVGYILTAFPVPDPTQTP